MLRLIVFLFIAIAFPALATEVPRTIDMTVALKGVDGNPAKDGTFAEKDKDGQPTCDKCPILTLGHAVAHALSGSYQDEQNLDYGQKWARGALANRIQDDKKAALTAPEIALIEKLIGKAYGPQIIVQVIPLLDPNAKPPEIK